MRELRRHLRILHTRRGPLLQLLGLIGGLLLLIVLARHPHQLTSGKAALPLYFISIGDYGAGNITQQQVADQLAKTVVQYGVQFILTLGDNFYARGVKSLEDNLWQKRFEAVYHHPSLHIPWHVCLGDHDHRGNVSAQLLYSHRSPRWRLPSPYYHHQVPIAPNSHLDIVVTDSIALEGALAEGPTGRRFFAEYTPQWTDAQAGRAHLDWLEAVLSNSTADWLIVAGHRPAKTCAVRDRFPGDESLMKALPPLLERHHVDAYLSGHDHVGQHWAVDGVQYLGNGLGGFRTHPLAPDTAAKWAGTGFNGFVLHKVTVERMVCSFIDSEGNVRYSIEVPMLRNKRFQKPL